MWWIMAGWLAVLVACAEPAIDSRAGAHLSMRGHLRQGLRARVPDRLAQGTSLRTIRLEGVERRYLLHVPPGSPPGPLPLVLSFHGLNSNANQEQRVTGFSELADRERFVAVYPDGIDARWHVFGMDDVDVRFVDAIVAELTRENKVDPRRIYANGISNGAQMTLRLACDRPGLLAAAGFVAGGYQQVCAEPRGSVILFHGTKDHVLPYAGPPMQMPVRDFARAWAATTACRAAQSGEIFYQKGDAKGERWTCGSRVVDLYTLEGKGHSWPASRMPAAITSRDVNASEAMWRFFVERESR